MGRINFIDNKGKKILIEDLSNMKAGPEFLAVLDEAKKVIASHPPKSVLAVMDVSGTNFNNEILNAVKQFTKDNTPYIKVSAVVGITGLLEVALTAVTKFAGRPIKSFSTREAAIEWLSQQ